MLSRYSEILECDNICVDKRPGITAPALMYAGRASRGARGAVGTTFAYTPRVSHEKS